MPDVKLPDVQIGNVTLRAGQMFSMKQYLDAKTGGYEKFGKGLDGPEQGLRIRATYNGSDKSFQLEDRDYEELMKCINGVGMAPEVAMHSMPFALAVKNAETVKINKGKKK